jgi:hypothetical protein
MKHSIRMPIRKYLIFFILIVSPLFNFPLFLVMETLVEHLAMPDFRKVANNKAFSPFLQAG